ncbi:uncharacterized protein LOC134681006 isoform X2 [Mytilus trossulus]|uniref:uncharacterized protein LOC134681006 isoform X2 n=1 Tax=Mytilus trossulus TaxID=6551 RepID=UPI00300755F7
MMEVSKIVLILFTVVTRSISSLQTCPEKSIWIVSECLCDLRRGYFGEDPYKCDQRNCSDGFILTRNGTCKLCTADDDVKNCYKSKRQTSNSTLTTPLIAVSILLAILLLICIVVLIVFILKRRRRKRDRNTAPRSSPLLALRRNHQEISSERNSSVYSYADSSVIGLSYRDVSNSSNLINRINLPMIDETKVKKTREQLRNAIPIPPRLHPSHSQEYSFSSPDVTISGSSLTIDSIDRCSTNKNVLSWNGEDVPDNRDIENDDMEYHGPIILPLAVPIYQTIEMENLLTDTTCVTTDLDDLSEDTKLMKPFLDDLSSNPPQQDMEQNLTAENIDDHRNVDDYEAIQVPQEPRNSFSNNAVTILGRLQTLILKEDSKLQRKTEETESLKEEVRRLRESVEQKDKELQDIHQYLGGIMDNFPHDRNSMEDICNDLQPSNPQTEDVKQDQSGNDIYYSKQLV